jgi:hypothetical protein
MAGTQVTTGATIGANEPTVMERGGTVPGPRPTMGSNEATVIERAGGGQAGVATVLEPKAGWAGGAGVAEPTVLERQAAAPPRKNVGLIAAIAAAVVIILGLGGYFMLRKPAPTPTPAVATTAVPSGTQVTTTASGRPGIAGDRGVLLLSASPWGDLEKIVSADDQKAIDITDDKRSTPTRIELAPGKYFVTVNGPDGAKTVDVSIEAGKPTRKKVDTGTVNLDELEKEMKQQ